MARLPRIAIAADELEEIAFNHGGSIEPDEQAGTMHLIHDGHEYVAPMAKASA